MKKINSKTFFYLPFLLSFTFLLRIPLFNNATINILDLLLLIAVISGFWILTKKDWLIDFWNYWMIKNSLITALIVLFTLGGIISLSFNAEKSDLINSFGLIKSFIFLPIVFSMFLSFFLNKKYLDLNIILKNLFISISILAVLGILAIFNKNLTFDERLSIFYDSPNHFAMIISPVIIIGIWLILFKKTNNKKIILGVLVLLILNLLFTKSLGAIIALIISIALLFLSKKNFIKLIRFSKISILIILFLSFILISKTSFLINKINYSPQIPPSSIDSRIAIYKSGEKIIKNNFPWGVGIGNFQETYLSYQKYFNPYPQWAIPHAHNNLFHINIEFGIISFLAFFVLLIIQFIKKQKKPEKILAFTILIYFLIHGIFDTTLWHNDTSFLFWFSLLII